jgi:hypothetical protein
MPQNGTAPRWNAHWGSLDYRAGFKPFVIPGRASSREPGIQPVILASGFRVCVLRTHPGMTAVNKFSLDGFGSAKIFLRQLATSATRRNHPNPSALFVQLTIQGG